MSTVDPGLAVDVTGDVQALEHDGITARRGAFPVPWVDRMHEDVLAAFADARSRDGGAIGDDEAAVAAARAYAETTRPSDRFGRVVETATDVRLRGSLDDDERDEAVSQLESLVGPPEVVAEEAGRYTVALTYLDGDVLERREVTVGDGGPVEVDREVLADGLPVPASL